MTHDLADELRLRPGPIPDTLTDPVVAREGFVASRDAFILSLFGGLRFHYRRGAGIRYEVPPELETASVASFHAGSVHGAAAWMNGFVPLHASAIAWRGGVHAFAGASGAGKSTLVAALAQRGFTLFADDVLTIAPDTVPTALPGHKRLRLWADALAMTGARRCERVWPGVDKFFVDPAGSLATPAPATPLPLASLTLLDDADAIEVAPIAGAARLIAVRDACYRPEYRLPEVRASSFTRLAELAARVPLFRFARPRDPSRFAEGVDHVIVHLDRITGQ